MGISNWHLFNTPCILLKNYLRNVPYQQFWKYQEIKLVYVRNSIWIVHIKADKSFKFKKLFEAWKQISFIKYFSKACEGYEIFKINTDLKFTIFCKLQRPEYTFQGDWRMLIPKIITILLDHLQFSRKLTE
jgi:hypothetical protein